jgi:diguanylate cyclase (GGDEF)-like protein
MTLAALFIRCDSSMANSFPPERFAVLQQVYLQKLPDTIKQVELLCQALLNLDWQSATLAELQQIVHQLAGSSAMYGLDELGKAAQAMEVFVDAVLLGEKVGTKEQRSQIQVLFNYLQQVASTLSPASSNSFSAYAPSQSDLTHASDRRRVLIVDSDADFAADLALQLSYFGYEVQILNQLSGFASALEPTAPSAIVIDVMFPEGGLAGTEAIAQMQQHREKPIPVLFISTRDDLTARLEAVRAGGNGYFTKPIEIGEVLDQLDTLTVRAMADPYRVLIVEDDNSLATYYALTLQQAGIETAFITNPLKTMATLVEFCPDLILMDVYMPSCNGVELAAVIRQQGGYIGVPIVFLSSETNVQRQLTAIRLGGDDFLTKPIQPDHLLASIMPRLQRSRLIRSLMERDSLTRLLNHTRIKEQLSLEIQRAIRQQTPLAFVMIDIDHFKQVNDTYGHLVGDRVLKSLSRLLKQRLRKIDTVGRYGGEEFAVILPNTTGAAAINVLNEMRTSFAQMRHHSENCEFSVTFSCGIACFPCYSGITELSSAADRALYQAKRQGRNRVILVDD